jgi:serine/threonine protein kinase
VTRRAFELLEAAPEDHPGGLESWVYAACEGEAALLEECRRLLESDATEGPIPRAPESLPHTLPPSSFSIGAGARVGPYELRELLDQGRSGEVWLAERRSAATEKGPRTVAIKLACVASGTRKSAMRFRIEVEALFKLDHPGIARVFDADAEASPMGVTTWIAMEYIKGDWITSISPGMSDMSGTRTPKPAADADWRERVGLVRQACDAMTHAHQRGVIHRDLKPANILITRSPEGTQPPWTVKVIDFGVARVRQLGTDLTLTLGEAIVGTIQYAAPEQLRGEVADARADVYGLAAVLYELLAGEPPVPSTLVGQDQGTLASINATLRHEPEWLGSRRPELPDSLVAVVHKALHKECDRRYASMAEFASDLDAVVLGLPVTARAPTVFEQARAVWRSRPRLAAAILTGIATLTLGIAGTSFALARALQSEAELRAQQDELQDIIVFMTSDAAIAMQDLPGGNPARHTMLVEFERRLEPLVRGVPVTKLDLGLGRVYARVLIELAFDAQSRRDIEHALALSTRAQALLQSLAAVHPWRTDPTPERLKLASDLSLSLVRLGDLANQALDSTSAVGWYERSLAIDAELSALDPFNRLYADNLVRGYCRKVMLALDANEINEARQLVQLARAAVDRLEAIAPDHRYTLHARYEVENRSSQVSLVTGEIEATHEAMRRSWQAASTYASQYPLSKHALLAATDAFNHAIKNLPTEETQSWFPRMLRLHDAISAASRAEPEDAYLALQAISLRHTMDTFILPRGHEREIAECFALEYDRLRVQGSNYQLQLRSLIRIVYTLVFYARGVDSFNKPLPGLDAGMRAGLETRVEDCARFLAEIRSRHPRGETLLSDSARLWEAELMGLRRGAEGAREGLALLGDPGSLRAARSRDPWDVACVLLHLAGESEKAEAACKEAVRLNSRD